MEGWTPSGMKWDRRWRSLARLMDDGEVIGEVSLNNGQWSGIVRGKACSAIRTDDPGVIRSIMDAVAEAAIPTA